ncbi:MAG: flagellar protein [Clostridiales bacterium]|jgi:hypothetical protein|nr:flagellar protein [Clostridiales bacterium]
MEDVRQCQECGKLFVYREKPLCHACLSALDEMFLKVRDYIYDHEHAEVAEISRETQVPLKTIQRFLKEERLSLTTAGDLVRCEVCGKPIACGRFCEGCKEVFKSAFTEKPKHAATHAPAADAGRNKGAMHVKYGDK